MKPVFNQITLIEDKKKTTEYEGYLKEVMATGFMDLEGVTTITQTQIASGAGGILDKEGYPFISNKVLIGDKFGSVHLFDVGRKLILDKKSLFEPQNPRRILSISTSSIIWVDSKLTYASIIARGSPFVKIVCFKHNENKLHLMYNLNICPHISNPDSLELNHEQSYLELPCESKISLDCLFLTVTSFNGEIKVLKMPPIFNPLKDDEPVQPPSTQSLQPTVKGASSTTPQLQVNHNPSASNLLVDDKTTLKAEIDNIPTQNIDIHTILISKIEARKDLKFKDPYVYSQHQETTPVIEVPQPVQKSAPGGKQQQHEQVPQPEHHEPPQLTLLERTQPQYNFKYHLGPKIVDLDGGDAGTLLKKAKYYPQVYFIRSAYCGKTAQPNVSEQSAKSIKQYFITTGIVIVYLNTLDIIVYNLQKPVKENVPWDYSQDYFNKIITQRKLNAKKKPEKSLAALIKTTRQKEEAVERAKNINQLSQELAQLKESMSKIVRQFRMPYNISCVAFQGTEDNYQSLAVGLLDGAVVIIDLILGVEKQFLEKHPAEITSLAFWEDKVLMSGSVDGRVNLNDLEGEDSENQKMNRCQNCQDRRIPVAKVMTSQEYGIGVGVDIEGNCRFYDLIRFKKIAKISSHNQRDSGGDARFLTGSSKCKWRLVPNIAYEVASDAFLAITQLSSIPIQEAHKLEGEGIQLHDRKYLSEKDLLVEKKYSDKKENLKSLNAIQRDTPEVPFYLQKSTLCIFRFEDVILNIYPHLASMKRKGMTIKEIFLKNDPQKEVATIAQQQQQNYLADKSKLGGDDSHMDSKKNIAAKSVISGNSNRKSEHFSVNFNLAPMGGQAPNNNSQLKQEYEFPTLKRLNPELYKEQAKQQKQMKDPTFQSVLHIKERYAYHEMRVQRIQKRGEDIGKELEAKNQEDILKNRKKNMGSNDVSSAVIDIGNYQTRAGYSGEDCPRSVIPSMVGIMDSYSNGGDVDMDDGTMKQKQKQGKNLIVGSSELNFKRDRMEIQPLFQDNGIMDFDFLEEILNKSLIENLMINPKETPLIFTENPIHNKESRLKLTEYMFEKYQVPAMFICKSPVLASFSCGRSTAVILDSGLKATYVTPVHDGYALQKCIIKNDIGGQHMTQDVLNWIEKERGLEVLPRFAFKKRFQNLNGTESQEIIKQDCSLVHPSYYQWSREEIIKDMKEEMLYVSEDQVDERSLETIRSVQYELPDGQQITFQGERISITEKMFTANDKIPGFTGMHSMVVESISKSDIDIRRDLFQNVILSGGNTLFKGFLDRLQRQIPEISPQNVKVKVICSTERKFSPWVGGSILSSLGSFQQMWMSRQEFEEHGAIMIERKCP